MSPRPVPNASYILPLRWHTENGLQELVEYLRWLDDWISVIVVDGSPQPLFDTHARVFPPTVTHIPPAPRPGANGKVAGVMTGVHEAQNEMLILADDDVRYTLEGLQQMVCLLENAEIVRPQNYFLALPWHARVDTARSLINRAFHADYPGTLGVRRSALMATNGYDGDVLFENLELLRTIAAAGGREVRASNLFVGRIPPTVSHYFNQRVRQAYDDFAQPPRLVAELSLLPLLITGMYLAARRRRFALLATLLATAWVAASVGRIRAGGREVFAASAPLWAVAWVPERALCVWAALVFRLCGGVPYAGNRLYKAANSSQQLQQKLQGRIVPTFTQGMHND